jgi:hypothetical protein
MGKNIEGRWPQGRRRILYERRQYFELMEKGYSNAAACKIVGINVRTGGEWKNGSFRIKRDDKLISHYEGCDRGEDRDFPSHFLSQSERIAIADARREGSGVRVGWLASPHNSKQTKIPLIYYLHAHKLNLKW